MKLYPVSSSRIRAAGWDGGTLRVEFESGHQYDYSNVPEWKYNAMIQAHSPGKYLSENIIDQHEHSRLK